MEDIRLTTFEDIQKEMQQHANRNDAETLQGFYKTGPGQYGEGDIFRGIRVPQIRNLVAHFRNIPFDVAIETLRSPWHEDRMLSLLLFVKWYKSGDSSLKASIYRTYLDNTKHINNWDLVDFSAGHIVGAHLVNRSRKPLHKLVKSPLLWDRRIALIATIHFIRNNDFDETLKLTEKLLYDKEDLIHKAMGWMLREIGKRDPLIEEAFLKRYLNILPRTTLRYAIERFPENKRVSYLKGTIKRT